MIKRIEEAGFTLVELIVVMVISMLLTGILLTFMFHYWRYSYVLDYTEESFAERLNVNDFLRDSIGSAVGLINQNGLPDQNANAPDPNIPSNLYWKIIHAIPGTYSVENDGSAVPLIYYRRYSFNNSNSYIMNGTVPYEDEYVLYIDSANKRVLLRSIANPNAPGNRLKTTCPPEIASVDCPTDKILINNISSVALRYFSRSGNFVDWTSIWDPINSTYAGPDFPTAEVVEFTFNVNRNAFFSSSNSTTNTTIVRVSLRNY
jgi:hypothetical protein